MFWGYLPLSEEEKKDIWENSSVVLDTNILLNLYRYSEKTQNEVFEILDGFKERFVIPKIVLDEFFANRDSVIQEHLDVCSEIKNLIDIEKIKSGIDSFRHQKLDFESLKKIINDFDFEINKFLDSCKTINFFDSDPILEKLVIWFDGKIIDNFEENVLQELYKEGEERYKKNIPPGYKDKNKSTGNNKYNDFIIWKHILQYASENKKNILFISDDLKEDWLTIRNGEKKGPRKELLNEFYSKTNHQRIYFYSTEGLGIAYNRYRKHEEEAISDEAIKEIGFIKDHRIHNVVHKITLYNPEIRDSSNNRSNKIDMLFYRLHDNIEKLHYLFLHGTNGEGNYFPHKEIIEQLKKIELIFMDIKRNSIYLPFIISDKRDDLYYFENKLQEFSEMMLRQIHFNKEGLTNGMEETIDILEEIRTRLKSLQYLVDEIQQSYSFEE